MVPKQTFCKTVFVDGCRTPFLRANTGFKAFNAYQLGRWALLGLKSRCGFEPQMIDRVILGTVISHIQTSNLAREAMLGAGYCETTAAQTVSQACISANAAISWGVHLIEQGQAKAVVAGGAESMSDVPILLRKKLRQRLADARKFKSFWDYRKLLMGLKWRDLLPAVPSISEFSTGRSMGEDCERMAAKAQISRKDQDAFALRSHQLSSQAWQDGHLEAETETVYLPPSFEPLSRDNGIRADSTAEKLARLKPAFLKKYGTITAGNASFLTDGGAAVLLMDEETARQAGFQPRARIRGMVFTGQDPAQELLLGPAYATAQLLNHMGLTLPEIDVFEFHEAFAAQVLVNLQYLASDAFARGRFPKDLAPGQVPLDKLNTWGGSLSIGHPFGATGARLLTTAVNRLHVQGGKWALVAACAAGGQGHAMLLERCS